MRADWNIRARADAHKYIAGAEGKSDQSFWASGRADLENLILHGVVLEPDAETLEIGCGVGRLLEPMSHRVRQVWGVDVSTEMVRTARRALAERPNVGIASTSGRLSTFADASIDFVYSYAVFQHIPSARAVSRYLSEAARVLKAGGVFRFQVDGRPRHGSRRRDTWQGVSFEDPRDLVRSVELAGFRVAALWGEHTHYFWVTAVREKTSGRPRSRSVQARVRGWRQPALEDVLRKLAVPEEEAHRVASGEISLRLAAEAFLTEKEHEEPREFVVRAYRALLGRDADTAGLAFYVDQIASGFPRSYVIDCLVSSPELEERLREDAATA
jgi:SAM-dependent methyltransferase